MANNLAANEDLVKIVTDEISTLVDRYKTQREDVDDMNKIAEYMYSCAQNRTIESAEKSMGMNMDADTRSNVGSVLYHRIVNQLASQLEAVLWSKPDLFRYEAVSTDGAEANYDGQDRADQANALARWTIKRDEFLERVPVFTRSLFKKSNIFVKIDQVRVEKTITRKVPEFGMEIDTVTGEQTSVIIGESEQTETKIIKNHPSITFPSVASIYLDAYIGDMQQQHCVAIVSLKTKGELYSGVTNEWYDQEQYEKLDDSHKWDGQAEREALDDKEDVRNQTVDVDRAENLYLVWDVYINIPMKDSGDYDEEGVEVPERYWLTLVGNTIGNSLCLRFERNPEPDDEIPLKDIHVFPGEGDRMYHTTTAEIVRSGYSADCTLLNLMLDNMGLMNDPPKMVVEGQHNIKNDEWTFSKGRLWRVYDVNAIKSFQVPDNTQNTLVTKQDVERSIMMAMNVDKAFVGQSQGARTSASEATFINRNSMQPHLSQIRYILMQLLPWMARKYQTYWQAYGDPDQVVQITDTNKRYQRIKPTEVFGEYDVKIDIIDEYESDIIKQQQLQNLLNIVAANEWLQRNETEQIDGPAIFKDIVRSFKMDPAKYITSRAGGDAERAALEDIDMMLYQGQEVPIDDRMDLKTHLRVKEAALTEWKGVEQRAVAQGIRVDILAAHVQQLKQRIAGGAMTSQQVPQQSMPGSGLVTEGTIEGQQRAGEMGGLV